MVASLSDVAWPVHGARVVLRPAAPADAEPTWQFRRLASVGRWMRSSATDLEEYRIAFIDRLATTLMIELDGIVIGDLGLHVEDAWAQTEVKDQARSVQAELGWCLGPKYEGHGYAAEAVTELITICFEQLGLRRVTAHCFADNHSSRRLMERLGMRRETYTIRESLHRSGQWLDGMGYALLADEWHPRQHDP